MLIQRCLDCKKITLLQWSKRKNARKFSHLKFLFLLINLTSTSTKSKNLIFSFLESYFYNSVHFNNFQFMTLAKSPLDLNWSKSILIRLETDTHPNFMQWFNGWLKSSLKSDQNLEIFSILLIRTITVKNQHQFKTQLLTFLHKYLVITLRITSKETRQYLNLISIQI